MRAVYSSQTQAHLGSDAEYSAIKSYGGTSWWTHMRAKKAQKYNDRVNHTLMYSRSERAVMSRSHMCETQQKGSERPQITTSLQLIRNYCRASKSVSWDDLPNILQERNTSKSGWKFLSQAQSTLALHSWLWLSWGRFSLLVCAFFPSAVIFFFSSLFLSLFCALTRHES